VNLDELVEDADEQVHLDDSLTSIYQPIL
jgi:DNA-directed RNA polymerase III subunit RPC7